MFPFQKIFTIMIRTFSRPALQYIKKKQQTNNSSLIGRIFIKFGRRTHIIEQWINYRILKNLSAKHYNELKQQTYLEKGVQMFYEILFYVIVLGLPLWQMYKSANAAQEKERKLQNRLKNIQKNMILINNKVRAVVQYSKMKNKQTLMKNRVNVKDEGLKIDVKGKFEGMGEIGLQQKDQIGEKVQQIFENVLQVIADEFEDILDDIDISNNDLVSQNIQPDIQVDQIDSSMPQEVSIEDNDPL